MAIDERTTTCSSGVYPQVGQPKDPPLTTVNQPAGSRSLAEVIVAVVATIFALYWAQRFFIPLFLGIVLAYTLNPLVTWMERIKIPRLVGTTIVMVTLLFGIALGTLSLRGQVERILDQVPDAAGKLSVVLKDMAAQPNTVLKVQAAALEIEQATNQAASGTTASQKPPTRVVIEEPKFKLLTWLWTGSLGMFGIIGETAMMLILVIFLLLSGDTFKRKFMRISGPSLSKRKITAAILDDIDRSIQNYMLTLLMANVLLGILTWLAFRLIGLDNAGAWAVAAGVLHFIPYLGPALTAVATGMAGFMQFESLSIATLVGMVLVTWMCGKISNMNTTAVFVALLFWGWLWGIWGLLFAIPITGMVKVFAERVEDLRPVAELLSD
jgi:predicted PurR-regulated permease PerM